VVKGGGNPKELHCVHHGVKTQNTRELLSKKPVSASGMTNDTALSSVDSESTDFKFVPSSASGLEPDSEESRSHTSGESSSTQYRVQENTAVQGMGCKWQIYVFFLSVLLEGEQLKGDGS